MLSLCYALQGLALEVSTFLLLQRFQLQVDQIPSELGASSCYLTHATLWTWPLFFCHMLPTYAHGVLFLVCKQPSPAASSQDARRLRASRFYFPCIFFSFGFWVPGLPLFLKGGITQVCMFSFFLFTSTSHEHVAISLRIPFDLY